MDMPIGGIGSQSFTELQGIQSAGSQVVTENTNPSIQQAIENVIKNLQSEGKEIPAALNDMRTSSTNFTNVKENSNPITSIWQKIKNFFSRNDSQATAALHLAKEAQKLVETDSTSAQMLMGKADELLANSSKHSVDLATNMKQISSDVDQKAIQTDAQYLRSKGINAQKLAFDFYQTVGWEDSRKVESLADTVKEATKYLEACYTHNTLEKPDDNNYNFLLKTIESARDDIVNSIDGYSNESEKTSLKASLAQMNKLLDFMS